MKNRFFILNQVGIAAAVWMVLTFSGCSENTAPVSPPDIIRMKISKATQPDVPSRQVAAKIPDTGKPEKESAGRIEPKKNSKRKPAEQAVKTEDNSSPPTDTENTTSDNVPVFQPDARPMLSDVKKLTYRPEGKIDPFVPLFKDEPVAAPVVEKSLRKKRVPQTPLEKMDLSQLKLTAIFQTPKGFKALVEESTGKGYMITVGTYIGRNSGKVTSIQKRAVLVEEEIEDALGKVRTETRELKLLKPTGEQ